MSRGCTVCLSAKRCDVDRALVAGTPYRNVAQQQGLSPNAVYRHQKSHLATALVAAHKAQQVATADSVLEEITTVKNYAMEVLNRVREGGNVTSISTMTRTVMSSLELLAKIGYAQAQQQAANGVEEEPCECRRMYRLDHMTIEELRTLRELAEKARFYPLERYMPSTVPSGAQSPGPRGSGSTPSSYETEVLDAEVVEAAR